MKRIIGFLTAFLIAGAAYGQAVQQSGTVTPGHASSWVTTGVIKDAGSATAPNITELGVTKNGGIPFSINSANTGAITRIYPSVTSGSASLNVQSAGGASDATLTINMNGNNVVLPAAPGGTIWPTVNTDVPLSNGAPVCLSGTDGTLKNCGGTPGSGTVTEVDTGTGLTGGPITTTGTISLAPIANATFLGNSSGSSAAPTAQSVSGSFSLSSGTLSLSTIASGSVLGNATGGAAEPVGTTLSAMIDAAFGSTRGGLLTRGASGWGILAPSSTAGQVVTSNGTGADLSYQSVSSLNVPVRQTVLSGPVDSNGLPSFGGSTGSTTVTGTGTLIATNANGFNSAGAVNNICSITDPSWTGLSTPGTMYLYLDAASSTCTTGSTTLAPNYQWGGTYSTTSNQFTFNIQEMVGKLGNGSTADQSNLVFVGQVTVGGGGTVSAITWYALQGRYQGPFTATLPSTATTVSASHNIGTSQIDAYFEIECTTTDQGYAVGNRLQTIGSYSSTSGVALPIMPRYSSIDISITTMSSQAFAVINTSTGNSGALTAADWKYHFVAKRRW